MEPLLPDSDPDLTLARRLEAGADFPDDPLARRLAAYRQESAPAAVDAARSDTLWEGIAARTRPAARIHRLPVWTRWAAAAAVLAAVALAALWMRPREAPLFYAVAPGTTPQTVALPDGSEVTLRPGATLRQVGAHRYRLQGEAFFAVVHQPARTFTVEAGPATVEVLGTRFDVRADEEETSVYLETGRVRFARADSAVVLAPGESSTLAGGFPTPPAAGQAEAALDWLKGQLVFNRQPLARVARELESHYGLRLVLPTDFGRETVTGTLVLGDADDTLARLARVAGGRFEQMDAQTYRLVAE